MNLFFSLLNALSVSLFGSVLSASFCDALSTPKKRRLFWLCALTLPLLQGIMFLSRDYEFVRLIYPVTVHLPLWLVLCALTGKYLSPAVSVLSAYLCCQLRRWIVLLIVTLFSGGQLLQDILELAITLPLIWLLLRHVSPVFREMMCYPRRELLQFGVVPLLYYCFDYLTRIYSDLLTSGAPVAVEFMPFVCCAVYLSFLIYTSARRSAHERLLLQNKHLDMQLKQSVRELSALRTSQEQAARYRHDLRHHLQYLASCLENGQTEQAKDYIGDICKDIETGAVERQCENETANLILSAFIGRAKKVGITLNVHAVLPATLDISDNDLCVLLSNALENAINACTALPTGNEPVIEVLCYVKEGKFFLQIINPYHGELRFKGDIPISSHPDHGLGIPGICAIVKRHGGVYSFLTEKGQFILRLSL